MKVSSGELSKLFHDAHKTGAEEFGVAWLLANEQAVEQAQRVGLNYSEAKVKTLLSLTTLAVLRALRKDGRTK